MKNRFGAKREESLLLRFHTQTAGCSLTAQQPENNIVRTAYEALSAVLGGTQSLHTNSMDETLALPSEKAVLIALRTQQVLAHETGVVNTIDPLAGSYYVESLTNRLEQGAYQYFEKIERLGGMVKAIEAGFPQREIADAAYRYQRAIEKKERVIVGVNDYQTEQESLEIPLLRIDERVEHEQRERLASLRKRRDGSKVKKALTDLDAAARGNENLMPHLLEAALAYATLGETVGVLRKIFGTYREPAMY